MGHLIGYARVSTAEQDLSLQLEALRHAGCQEAWIFHDTASGAHTARPGLEACIRALTPGDTLVVWRLDRLGRSMTHLVTMIEELLGRQGGFRALCDGAIDTTTASGELVFHIFSALAQFERRLIQERTRAGLAAARARGRRGGRKPRHAEEPRVRMAYTLYVDQRLSSADICQTLRISQATFYRYVALGRLALFSCIRSLQPQRSSSSLSAVSVSSSSLSASSSASARLNQCSRRRLRTAAAAGRWRAAGRRRRVGGQVARHRVGAHGWRTRLVEKAV